MLEHSFNRTQCDHKRMGVQVFNLTFLAGLTVVWAAVPKLHTGLITETSSITEIIHSLAAQYCGF